MWLSTSDGGRVAADLIRSADPWAGAVVCHPHPAYGGDRHNVVVDAIFQALGAAGATVLRFDFRPDGDNVADVVAGLDAVGQHVGTGRPLWLVGYSFGADIALGVGDERVAGWATVAPPLRFGPGARAAAGDPRPVLAVVPEHDQVNPPAVLRPAIAGWPDATVVVVPGADHFLAGATGRVADAVLTWLREPAPRPRATP